MPELPEVETTLRGVKPHILNQRISKLIIRHYNLRWPIAQNIPQEVQGQYIKDVIRRGKYLLFQTPGGALIFHLGMSGTLRLVNAATPLLKHDHVDIVFAHQKILRFNDPRRFGSLFWHAEPLQHQLLKDLGVEPLSLNFSSSYLWKKVQKRKTPIKTLIMNSKIVVGVGNIYATEALFNAKIHPLKPAGALSLAECSRLSRAIKNILRAAIKKGGTTLKDFYDSEGKPGYFSLSLRVYGRKGQACKVCKKKLLALKVGQRSTVYCAFCQKK